METGCNTGPRGYWQQPRKSHGLKSRSRLIRARFASIRPKRIAKLRVMASTRLIGINPDEQGSRSSCTRYDATKGGFLFDEPPFHTPPIPFLPQKNLSIYCNAIGTCCMQLRICCTPPKYPWVYRTLSRCCNRIVHRSTSTLHILPSTTKREP